MMPTTETDCANGMDEDGDTLIDCDDSDCDESPACSMIIINEVDYDSPGPSDAGEFIEIYNPGPHATNLNGVAVLLVNGNANPVPAVYSPSTPLDGNILQPGGYLVVAQSGVTVDPNATKITFTGGVQNGSTPNGAPGDAVVLFDTADAMLLDAISYEAPVLNATINGSSFDLYEGPMPPPSTLPGEVEPNVGDPDTSIIRYLNGADTGDDTVDIRVTSIPTPGKSNQIGEICNNMVDDDGDMNIDCADSDCSAAANCQEICNDGMDNNGNGQTDCQEMSCNGKSCGANGKICIMNACSCASAVESCGDGMDNDCDGQIDCMDTDCAGSMMCTGETICNDGMDNDMDNAADCLDSDCNGKTCAANGKVCASSVCSCPGGATTETSCTDTTDNDCDGQVDCADSDCNGNAACATPILFINELHYDNASTDTGEGVEVAGTAGLNLTGYTIYLYDGSLKTSYDNFPLSGTLSNQMNGFGTAWFLRAGIQNGAPDGVALVGPGNVVIQFISYEGSFTATGGPAAGMTSTDIGVSESGSGAVGLTLQLTGTYPALTWAMPFTGTPNAINTGEMF